MPRKYTEIEAKEKIFNKTNGKIKLVGPYIAAWTITEFECFCGNIFKTTPNRIWNGHTKSCGHSSRKTYTIDELNTKILCIFKLKILEQSDIKITTSHKYSFQCSCGIIFKSVLRDVLTGAIRSCGCYNKWILHKLNYNGTKNISGEYFAKLENRAKTKKLDFNISIDYIQKLLEKQNYKCKLSGMDICGSQNNHFRTNKPNLLYQEQTASLDRINNNQGYIKGNVQWVHKNINWAKRKLSDQEFIELCRTVVKYNE